MTFPLVVLALGSLFAGFLGTPEFLGLGPNRFEAGSSTRSSRPARPAVHTEHPGSAMGLDGLERWTSTARWRPTRRARAHPEAPHQVAEHSLSGSRAPSAAAPHAAEHGAHDTTMEWILMFASLGLTCKRSGSSWG
ncbi:MAG: hypothetical protein R3E12_19525 [Candidatus Eisenbacteria bacterium]